MDDRVEFDYRSSNPETNFVPRAVLEISESINNSQNLDELFNKVHQIISEYIPSDSFYIALYDNDTKEIIYPFYFDQLDESLNSEKFTQGFDDITTFAINHDNPLLITAKMFNELVKTGKISETSEMFSEWLGVPLKTNDNQTIGLMALQRNKSELVFSDSHQSFLRFVSEQIAKAIQYKRTEEELKNNELKFRMLYSKNPLMLFIVDENGKVIDANERTKIDLGYEAQELVGKNVKSVFHPDDQLMITKNIKECLAKKGSTLVWELRKITKGGETIWVREYASVLDFPAEKKTILIACENINEIKKAQLNIISSEEKYKLLTNNIDEMILMHDVNGEINYVNEAGLSLSGFDFSELMGRNIYKLFSEEYGHEIRDYIANSEKINSLFLFEVKLICKNGLKIPLEISVNKLKKHNSHENLLVVARDTRLRKSEVQNLRDYNEELKKSNSAKDKFFSIIAHDLRSPFNALLSYTEILLEDFDELKKDELKEYIHHIKNVSGNIFELLNNLLDWSRMQTDKYQIDPVNVDIQEAIYVVLRLFRESAKSKKIDMQFESDTRCYAYADANMISTILRNLISNAIKFSEDNSVIKISSTNEKDYVRVTIEDNGVGMLEEDIAKLFRIDINYTTLGTHKEKGTGLGLVLSKEMIEKNGGEIFVESHIGKGTKFSFTIPKK